MSVAYLRFAPVRETKFPPRAPFFKGRLSEHAVATAAVNAEEKERGNLPVSPYAPSPAHRPGADR